MKREDYWLFLPKTRSSLSNRELKRMGLIRAGQTFRRTTTGRPIRLVEHRFYLWENKCTEVGIAGRTIFHDASLHLNWRQAELKKMMK